MKITYKTVKPMNVRKTDGLFNKGIEIQTSLHKKFTCGTDYSVTTVTAATAFVVNDQLHLFSQRCGLSSTHGRQCQGTAAGVT